MPVTDLHKQKRKKNIAVFLLILALAGVLFAVTLLRVPMGG